MISDRTKQFIFNNLIKDLSNVEIIRHDESLWFIDREKKYWYLELVKTGKLYWRYQFFTEFFDMYSINRDVYEPIIKEFAELVLNNGITSTETTMAVSSKMVSTVLNNGITSTQVEYGVFRNEKVEDALNNGVTSSRPANKSLTIVDSVLSNGITSTHEIAGLSDDIVNSVLTNGVTTKLRGGNATEQIKYVLNDGITSTQVEFGLSPIKLDLILKEGVDNLMPLNGNRETMIKYVLKDNPR